MQFGQAAVVGRQQCPRWLREEPHHRRTAPRAPSAPGTRLPGRPPPRAPGSMPAVSPPGSPASDPLSRSWTGPPVEVNVANVAQNMLPAPLPHINSANVANVAQSMLPAPLPHMYFNPVQWHTPVPMVPAPHALHAQHARNAWVWGPVGPVGPAGPVGPVGPVGPCAVPQLNQQPVVQTALFQWLPAPAPAPRHPRHPLRSAPAWSPPLPAQAMAPAPMARAPAMIPAPDLDGGDAKGSGLMATRFGGQQESDMLEKLGLKHQPVDSAVQLVSLGSYCGPKLSFQKMGRGAATLPFDWIRTRMSGILHFLRNDFQGFFDFETQQRVPQTDKMVMFRGYHHSFWHDDPTEPIMRERYKRRIERLKEINAESHTVLCVRSMVSNEEVLQVPELMTELRKLFGPSVRLLLILENQKQMLGPATVDKEDTVMLYYLSMDVHRKGHPDNNAPYARPVQCALDWVAGKPLGCHELDSLQKAFELTDPYPGGEKGLGGLCAFEEEPPDARQAKIPMEPEPENQWRGNCQPNPFEYESIYEKKLMHISRSPLQHLVASCL
ncbi:unnamed protein product [Effrenium voratum]|nr:unnamed protein product [Effrenium voratum]